MNPKRPTPSHSINKMPKIKYKKVILKSARKKQFVLYKGAPKRLSADLSTETFQARRDWREIVQVMKSKDL